VQQFLATVIPAGDPAQVQAIAGAPAPNGVGRWDPTLVSASPAGNADFQYRIVIDGQAGQVNPAKPGDVLSDPSAYGHPDVGFQLRACDQWPEVTHCSTSRSQTFPLPDPIDNSELGSHTADNAGGLGGGTWSWGSIPAGSYPAMDVSCDNGASWTPLVANSSCQAGGIVRMNVLRVRNTANGGQTYLREYDPADYPG
jgi:hypothetical protein